MSEIANLPNVFLIGAMKAGTTSLATAMSRHDDIFLGSEKEPNYFNHVGEVELRYSSLRQPNYRDAKPISHPRFSTLEEYLELYAPGASCKYRLDASTMYMPSPIAAREIATMVPDARIIAVLRDPFERAYSSYTYMRYRGWEVAPTFRAALEEEIAGKRADMIYSCRHIETSQYGRQLARFHEFFDASQIRLYSFDALKDHFDSTFDAILAFLELPPLATYFPRDNVTYNHTSLIGRTLMPMLNDASLRSAFRRKLPDKFVDVGKICVNRAIDLVNKFGDRPVPPDPADFELMRPFIEADREEFTDILIPMAGDVVSA